MGEGRAEHDVIVVGAGPAGAAFVRTARDLAPDLRILVLDKAVFPRDKVCGDALTHTSAPLVLEIFSELHGTIPTASATRRYTLRYPGGRVFSRDDQDLDVIPRRVFDQLLWDAARHDGIDSIEGARVVDVLREGDRVAGVVARVDGEDVELRAGLVLAADGSNSVVRKKTRTGPVAPSPIAVRQYVRGVPPTDDGLVFMVDPEHHGYFWFFPIVGEDEWSANIGWFGFGGRQRSVNPRERLESFLARDAAARRYLGDGRREGPVQAFPLNLAPFRRGGLVPARAMWGDGYLLLGDAAGMVHPFTGEGIAFALQSGRRAAELLAAGGSEPIGPRYQDDLVAFAEDVYSLTRTNLLFRLPCVVPGPLTSPYLAALPVLDRGRKGIKAARRVIRSVRPDSTTAD